MKRWLFTISAAMSLAVCLAILCLWIRSYFVNDALASAQYTWHDIAQMQHVEKIIGSSTGKFWLATITFQFKRDQDPKWNLVQDQPWSVRRSSGGFEFPKTTLLNHVGFGVRRSNLPGERGHGGAHLFGNESLFAVWIPHWLLFAITAALPALWAIRRWRRTRRDRQGKCAVCGYDLRATPDRCPECGQASVTHAAG